jgi:hypothetical protein
VRAFNLHAQLLGQHRRLAAMVDMAVRDQDLLDLDAGLLGRGFELRQVAARIDERALVGRGAPEERAVLLERRHGNDRRFERGIGHARDVALASAPGKP